MAQNLKQLLNVVAKPVDDYDPAWVAFNAANPHLRRSVGAAAADGDDFSWAPDEFVSDGKLDTEGFKTHYQDLTTKAQQTTDVSWAPQEFVKDGQLDTKGFMEKHTDLVAGAARDAEIRASLPKTADEYQAVVPEKLTLPEGVTLPEGFEPKMNPDDPDLPALKALMHEHNIPNDVFQKILEIDLVREVRRHNAVQSVATEEIKALGPDGKARMDAVTRSLQGRLSEKEAKDVIDGIHSADTLRGIEKLLHQNKGSAPNPGGKPNMSELSIDDRLNMHFDRQKAG